MKYEPNKYVSISTVALRWNVSPKTIQRLIAAGQLKAAKFGTRSLSVLSEDVERYERAAEAKVA